MNLTAEQVTAIKDGEPVTVAAPEVGVECVVIRSDVFERVRNLLYDDSEMDPREAYPAVLRAWDDEGDPDDALLYRP